MKMSLLKSLAAVCLMLAPVAAECGQSAYFNAVTSLNPAGYWPMHEVETAAPGDIETNYGTLGPLGTGYYPDWAVSFPSFSRQVPGALAGDPDTALTFTKWVGNLANGAGVWTNQIYVPHNSPWTTLTPPFTVESWIYPIRTNSEGTLSVWGQHGYEGLNSGNAGGGFPQNGQGQGMQLAYSTVFTVYCNAGGTQSAILSSPTELQTNWYHVVVTFDADTNVTLYINGSSVGSASAAGKYNPDYWTPLTIGGARGGTRSAHAIIDEFAVYTNVIPDVGQHYSDGTNAAPATSYFYDVTNDNPVVYLRMDAPNYTAPPVGTWPSLINNGSVAANGVYTPGTIPGAITKPITNPNGVSLGGVSGNLAAMSGVSSFADAGYAPIYDPTGSNANFTVTAMFRGNPCDGRVQSIVSHGTNSWQLTVTTNGCVVFNAGNGNNKAAGGTGQNPGDFKTAGVYNDGQWHQVVAVNTTNVISIYVDGVLDTNGTPSGIATTNIIPGNPGDVMIGSDPSYTNNPIGVGRQFAGQVCEVAFFGQALAPAQVQALYTASGVAPYITTQPVGGSLVGGPGTYTNFAVTARGSAPAFQWYFNASPSYIGATALVDNVIHYTNSTTSRLTVTNLVAADNGYYFVVVTNNFGSATSALANLTVNTKVVISAQLPATYTNLFTLFAGSSPAFSVTAVGTPPITYRWFTNGVLNGAATGSNYIWPNLQAGFITNYCVAGNGSSSATSMVWTAEVIARPTAPYPASVLALGPIGYWRLSEADNGSGNQGVPALDYAGGNDGLYTNAYLGNGSYSPGTDPSDTSALFGSVASEDSDVFGIQGINFSAPTNTSANFSVQAWVYGFGTQTNPGAGIVTLGYGNGGEQFDLDVFSGGCRFFVHDAGGNTHSVTTGVNPVNQWFHLVGVCDEVNGQVSLYINGVLAGTTPIAPGSGLLPATRAMTIGARSSTSTANNDLQFKGYIDDVAVFNYALSMNQVVAEYSSVGSVPPYFVQTPPATITINGGATLILPAIAAGTAPIGYYWTDVNAGTNVASAATNGLPLNATLNLNGNSVPGSWNGDQLELTVTNAAGSVNTFVSLTIITNLQIVSDLPASVSVVSGASYTYSIGVAGPVPYAYQWYHAGSAVANQTNSTYTVTAGAVGTSATYYVSVTDSAGTVFSSTSTLKSIAQLTNTYSTGILQLNPAGYWPMHEAEAAARGDIETNYGTLGLQGTAYYPDWAVNAGAFTRQVPGALGGGTDMALSFDYNVGTLGNGAGVWTNVLYVPHTSPLATLNPPFSVECWLYNTNTSAGQLNQSVWGQHGWEGFNAGIAGGGSGSSTISGMQLAMNSAATITIYGYFNGVQNQIIGGGAGASMNTWNHVVVTCDANTNFQLYVNGTLQASAAGAGKYSPDYWTPLTIGGTRGGTRSAVISVDQFAVYTNVIPDIAAHYAAAGSVIDYSNAVASDNPVIYLPMDAPPYTPPGVGSWPEVINYGSVGNPGVYTPGTAPGVVGGPANNGVNYAGLSGTKVAALSGVSSFADAGYASAYNPTGSNANFTVTAMFRGNPCDNRIQTIASHGTNSWQLNITTNGCIVFNAGNGNTATGGTGQNPGDLTSAKVYNDGKWHQVAAVNTANMVSIYVDGVLDTNGTPAGITPTSVIPGNLGDVMIGADPSYTNIPVGVGRQFAGQVCEVAFLNQALTAAQVQNLSKLAITGSTINTNPTNIVFSVSGGQLTLSWPADHIGWTLQAQTNKLTIGISNNWADVAGSAATNQVIVPIITTNGSVFYRLNYQP